jgi:hypothetical protein
VPVIEVVPLFGHETCCRQRPEQELWAKPAEVKIGRYRVTANSAQARRAIFIVSLGKSRTAKAG